MWIPPYPLPCHTAIRVLFLKSKQNVILVLERFLTMAQGSPCPLWLHPISSQSLPSQERTLSWNHLHSYLWFFPFLHSSIHHLVLSLLPLKWIVNVSNSLHLHYTTLVLVTLISYGDQQPRWQTIASHLLTGFSVSILDFHIIYFAHTTARKRERETERERESTVKNIVSLIGLTTSIRFPLPSNEV